MRIYLLLLLIFPSLALAQKNDPWFAFWDNKTELKGFKDKAGKVRIKPKFVGMTSALRFNNIMAVLEEKKDKYISYYLLKNGKMVGINDTYVNDATFDCERENMIRFRDHGSNKVGYFDSSGNIAIPALYSDASRFRNGMAVALKDAKQVCPGGGEYSKSNRCEHWLWSGGKTFLLDKKGKVLIENFDLNSDIDWYSLTISDVASSSPQIVSFKGINGKYYQFVDVIKVFDAWLHSTFLENLNKRGLIEHSFSEITYWTDEKGWIAEDKSDFIGRNLNLVKDELTRVKNSSLNNTIFLEELNSLIYNGEDYRKYYDDCGDANKWQYPVLSLVIDHNVSNDLYQNSFDFLKTDNGYKLISLTLRKAKLSGSKD